MDILSILISDIFSLILILIEDKMLKIPKSAEYAFLALKYISEADKLISVKEISDNVNIPFELLAKIMQKLSKSNIITSVQGTKGGYTLSSEPKNIRLSSIMSALNQDVQMTDCMVENPTAEDCKRVNNCCLVNPVKKIQLKINQLMDELTLEAIIN